MEPIYGIFRTELLNNSHALVKVSIGEFKNPDEAEKALKDSKQYNDGLNYIILPYYQVRK